MKNNIFFHQSDHLSEKKNFDSYSRTSSDLIMFYLEKYSEISNQYKRNTPLSIKEFEKLNNTSSIKSYLKEVDVKNNPFELFTISMINFMEKQYEKALFCFNKCISILEKDTTLNSKINIVFMRLNMASIYQLNGYFNQAIRELLIIIKTFKNKAILAQSNNLLASTYNRLGGILLNNFQNNKLAYYPFFKSIMLRNNYYNKYPKYVCDNYLSSTYKLFAFCQKNINDKNYYFKKSITIREVLLEKFNDEYNSIELFYSYFDYTKFLIINRYNHFVILSQTHQLHMFLITYIKRLSEHVNQVFTSCVMLYRFYNKVEMIEEMDKWREFINSLIYNNDFKGKISTQNILIANSLKVL